VNICFFRQMLLLGWLGLVAFVITKNSG